jgi:hypothetical protein
LGRDHEDEAAADLISRDTMARGPICYAVAGTFNARFMAMRRDSSWARSELPRCPESKKLSGSACKESKMDSSSVTLLYDDLPGLERRSDTLPTLLGLAACLESLEIDAIQLEQRLAASLIGAARLALLRL